MVADLAAARAPLPRSTPARSATARRARGGRSCCCAPRRRRAGGRAPVAPGNRLARRDAALHAAAPPAARRAVGRAVRADQRQRLRRADRLPDDDALRAARRASPTPSSSTTAPSTSGPTTRWCASFRGRERPCGARAATCRSRSSCPGAVPPAGAGLRRRAEEHLLPGRRAGTPSSPTTSATWRTPRRCARSPRASSTSAGSSTSSPRSSPTTCTRSTCRRSTRSSWTGVELRRRAAPPRPHRRLPGRQRRGGAGDRRRLRRARATAPTARIWGGEFLVADLAGFERAGAPRAGADAGRRGGDPASRGGWRRPTSTRPSVTPVPRDAGRGRGATRRWAPVVAVARARVGLPADVERRAAVRRRRGAPRRPGRGHLRGPGRDRAGAAGRPGGDGAPTRPTRRTRTDGAPFGGRDRPGPGGRRGPGAAGVPAAVAAALPRRRWRGAIVARVRPSATTPGWRRWRCPAGSSRTCCCSSGPSPAWSRGFRVLTTPGCPPTTAGSASARPPSPPRGVAGRPRRSRQRTPNRPANRARRTARLTGHASLGPPGMGPRSRWGRRR